MSLPRKSHIIAVCLFIFAVTSSSVALIAQQSGGEIPFLYPDPRTVGVQPYIMQGTPAGAVTRDRYAGISEEERLERILWEQCLLEAGMPIPEQPPCPLCAENPMTPCGTCKMCVAGLPCEKTLCRHCVQPRSKNMSSSCDLTAGDEPCGTCDSCREHRSDPCEHADTGYGPLGEYNPYREPRLLSVLPRPILDLYNNGARKFPVYYNPAPYYRPTWNPAMFAGYARPYTFRYTCPLCFRDPCGCNAPGMAGQVPYAFTCKFCNRNPCACAAEICNVTKPMDPKGISAALEAMRAEEEKQPQPVEIRDTPLSATPGTPTGGGTDGTPVGELFEDAIPVVPQEGEPDAPARPSLLDTPASETPAPVGNVTVRRSLAGS